MAKFFRKLWAKSPWICVALGANALVIIVILVLVVIIFATDGSEEMPIVYVPSNVVTSPSAVSPYLNQDPNQSMRWDYYAPIDTRPRSMLTGLPIDEENEGRRPIAVVINNIRAAWPQSGVASADVIYEALAEGDVTRLVVIFQSYVPEKIGPVRSARDYFVDFAFNHDAIFVHHGSSPSGTSRIRNTGIQNLDGLALEGSVFWRDRDYPYWHSNAGSRRPLEHSSYTSYERMNTHMEARSIRDFASDNPAYEFVFGAMQEGGGIAETVIVPFSQGYRRFFNVDPQTMWYWVENRDGPHVDAETREQVKVANVLIQLTTMRVIDGEGRRDVQTLGEGDGFLITGGRYFPVRWVKEGHAIPTRWYFGDGSPLVLSPGPTWICVVQSNIILEFGEISEDE